LVEGLRIACNRWELGGNATKKKNIDMLPSGDGKMGYAGIWKTGEHVMDR
jgi:hypothetical protein